MIHVIDPSELKLHIRSAGCRCNPVLDIDENGEPFCVHLPLSINLKGITNDTDEADIDDDDILPFTDDAKDG